MGPPSYMWSMADQHFGMWHMTEYRTFYPKKAEYTYFSSANGTFSRIDHVRPQNKPQEI